MEKKDYTHEEKQAELGLGELELVSGEVVFERFNTVDFNEKNYEMYKMHLWLKMLNDRRKPTKWYKATKKGTRVKFDFIHNQEQYDQGMKELKDYMREVYGKYGVGI